MQQSLVSIQQVAAATGMGGIGKTQLAAAYAHRLWDGGGLDLLVWLTATGRDAILIGYAEAGADLTHPPAGEDTERVAGRFLAWLAATDRRWLIVLDDLTDPADLRGLWPQGPEPPRVQWRLGSAASRGSRSAI